MQTCWDQKVASFPCRLSLRSEPENEANQKVFALLKCEFKIAVKQWNGLGMRLLHKFIIVVLVSTSLHLSPTKTNLSGLSCSV